MLKRDIYRWEAALKLALKHQTHVDTVLAMRARYMAGMGREEAPDSEFRKYRQEISIDWDTIKKKIDAEIEKEANSPGARPYQE